MVRVVVSVQACELTLATPRIRAERALMAGAVGEIDAGVGAQAGLVVRDAVSEMDRLPTPQEVAR